MRTPPLDLRLLEVFEAVFVEKSLTNAAVKLAMSPPAVSQGLARLRALIRPENRVAALSSFIVAPLIARNSNVLVTVPSRVARIYADLFGLEQLALPLDLPAYPITQYWHARYHHDPGLVWVRRLLHELYSAGGEAHAELTPDALAMEYGE